MFLKKNALITALRTGKVQCRNSGMSGKNQKPKAWVWCRKIAPLALKPLIPVIPAGLFGAPKPAWGDAGISKHFLS
jgi:hypothetical protein